MPPGRSTHLLLPAPAPPLATRTRTPERDQIDAKHIEQHLDEEKPEGAENEAVEQVAFADRMLLNKTDLVTEADL